MAVHPRERQLLAQLLGVPVIRFDVDRPIEQKGFVETIQLLLNRLRAALHIRHIRFD
ncbi:hypothetical protein D3C83_102230 [compost metagenome]